MAKINQSQQDNGRLSNYANWGRAFSVLVLILILTFVLVFLLAEPGETQENISVIGIVTVVAIGIERLMETFWTMIGLTKGTFNQLFGLRSWIRGFQSAVVQQNGFARPIGDGFQMPGVFVIHEGEIQEAYVHKLSSDRPDYEQLVRNCCVIG